MRSKIIGATVVTNISPSAMERKINPVKSVNGVDPDENGNVEVKGNSGVYVGPGEIPEGYNIQIDPTGKAPVLVQSVNGVKPDPSGNVEIELPDSGDSEYTLPIATPDTLGGVQPVSKTDDMTQPVGVDELGGLWSVSGGGGGNANICNITVKTEQEVNGIKLELPATLSKFYIVEFIIDFADGLTEAAHLSFQQAGAFHNFAAPLSINTRQAVVFGLRYSDTRLYARMVSSTVTAYPDMPAGDIRISNTDKTITIRFEETDVYFPAGSSISVWGVYEK
jgi:hypothetical protein